MSQQRQFQIMGGNNDTTFTKIFVGGLAWETQRDTMRRYFEQFGEIQEAVVITDKNTGRSKGYGFVTFKDPEAAMRACQNPSPVIDGRRANCNLASLGAQKTRPPTPQHGSGHFRPTPGLVAPPAYHGSSSRYFHQPASQYTFPYSAYGYTGYSQDSMYPMVETNRMRYCYCPMVGWLQGDLMANFSYSLQPMLNYYGIYGTQQQYPPYYTTGSGASGPSIYNNFYPFYPQYGQSSQAHSFGLQYPQMLQYPYVTTHQYPSTGILTLPSSISTPTATTVGVTQTTVGASEQHSST